MADPRQSTPEEDAFFDQERAAQQQPEPEAPAEFEEAPREAAEAEALEPEGEEAPESPEGRRVPLAELLAERERRKELQGRVSQMEDTFQKFMARANQQPQYAPPQQQPAGFQLPDYETDPIGHLRARLDLVQGATVSGMQAQQQQQAIAQLTAHIEGLQAQFRAHTPDYDAAIQFAKMGRLGELQALGYDPASAANILQQEILGTSARAIQEGKNPAELYYAYAKARGFQAQPQPRGNGQAGPPAAAEKLATVQRAQVAARSMPKGGAAPPAAITLESLARMGDEDFDTNFDRLFKNS